MRKVLWLAGWVGIPVLVFVLVWMAFIWIPGTTRELRQEVQKAEAERTQRASMLQDLEAEFKQDADRYAAILRYFPWLTETSGGTAFLIRLGDVVTGLSLKVQAIGTLQRERLPQLEKVGRQIRLTGGFLDALKLVENAEQNKGILEELKIQRPPPKAGATEAANEVEAQFHLSTVELTPDVRSRLRAFIAVLPKGSKPEATETEGPLLLPVPERAIPTQVASLRDPFMIPGAVLARAAPGRTKGPQEPPPESPFPDLTLAGIVESPRGRMAIVNNQMLREGEIIEGVLVQRIRKNEVVFKSPFTVKQLTLPGFATTSQPPGDQAK